MWRILIAFSLLCVSSALLADVGAIPMNLPAFFQPAAQDLSVWILGNIFGSDLIAGSGISNIKLLSQVFGMFNQVALTVGMVIVVYHVITGSLNTAHEGKAMGDKTNAMWTPVRTSLGVALLVPKGGSGYCMAQYLVMWLTLQGIGAADTVWSTMLNYFQQGGAIYSGTTGNTSSYMNAANVDPMYTMGTGAVPYGCDNACSKLQSYNLLANMSCVANYNLDKATQALTGVKQYQIYAPNTGVMPGLIFFGNQAAVGTSIPPITSNLATTVIPGAECGYVLVGPTFSENSVSAASILQMLKNLVAGNAQATAAVSQIQAEIFASSQVYGMATFNYAQTLLPAAQLIATQASTSTAPSSSQFNSAAQAIQQGVQLYVSYIAGYETVLNPPGANNRTPVLTTLGQYGWILAGNYYSILSAYTENASSIATQYTPPKLPPIAYQAPVSLSSSPYAKPLAGFISQFQTWGNTTTASSGQDETSSSSSDASSTTNFHNIAGFGTAGQTGNVKGAGSNKNFIGIVDTDKLLSSITSTQSKTMKSSRIINVKMADQFIRMISGVSVAGREVSKDPVMRAAEHGKNLTDAAIVLFTVYLASSALLAAGAGAMAGVLPDWWVYSAALNVITPGILALGTFMYSAGALLGVFLPLIPAISFLTAAVGWILQCVESIAAAPLVAIGLIMPDASEEIWGRAKPAYMLTLNLFLRPSLMIVGFAAAMIVTWILVSLLNLTFLVLINVSFMIEDAFGYVTILTAYTGFLLYMVTEAYSLIVMVPNKVLHWIGDTSMGVKDAQQALQGGKADVEKGAAAVGAGAGHSGEGVKGAGEYAAKKEEFKQKQGIKGPSGGATPPPAPGGGGGAPPPTI